MTFGEFFRKKRIERGLTLRAFCQKHNFDPGNISRLERGKLLPPKGKTRLRAYATSLGLKQGTKDWEKFFDLASISRGEIPQDIMENSSELVSKLPLFFRTVRRGKLKRKTIEEMIELIKKS